MPRNRPLSRLISLVTLLVALTTLLAPSAMGASSATLGIEPSTPEPAADASIDEHRAWCRNEASRRVGKLESLNGEVAASLSLSTAHRSALNTMLTTTSAGIAALDEAIAAEADLATLLQLCRRIETDHLVFSLRTPQVQNVIGADAVVTRSRSLETDATGLVLRIDAAELIGNPNVARMRELDAAALVLAGGARSGVAGVSNQLLALVPPDWLDNRDILTPLQERNRVARADLEAVKANLEEIKRLLLWQPPDLTPPLVVPTINGPMGHNDWRTGDTTVTWSMTDDRSAITSSIGCDPTVVGADTAGQTVTCSATSEGGTQSVSVTVKRDGTPPTVIYADHPATYTVDQNVAIACAADDATAGLAASCAGINGAAYTFGLGTTSRSVTIADKAGNSATATTSFSVIVTPQSICNLTRQFVQDSPRYKALSAKLRNGVDALSAAVCASANGFTARLTPKQKAKLLEAYKAGVCALQKPGWLTQGQANLLQHFAESL